MDQYLATGETDEEYEDILHRLDTLTDAANVTFIYVARVGRSDYKTLTYIYNTVNSGTGFSRYPLRCTAADLTIDELFGNIAQYAYHPGTGPATVRVETAEDPLAVIITFIDKSVKFDPLAKEDPDISLSMEERGIGGLGIYMMKRTMGGISYEYLDGQNILRIKKNIEPV